MVGENSCEWAAWFRAQHESWSYTKVPSTFNATEWQLQHAALLNRIREEMEGKGATVFTQNQNSFTLRGSTAALGGKPDIISVSGETGLIVDAKTGSPSQSHAAQVMVYMYAVPRALQQYRGILFDGKVVYPDHEVVVPNNKIDATFVDNLAGLIRRVANSSPARKVPSLRECGFCNITRADCPERVAEDVMSEGETDDF